jgi:hypothetical protein
MCLRQQTRATSLPIAAPSRNLEKHAMTKIAIVLGSTRPGRRGEAVANWVLDIAKQRSDAE